MDLFDYMRLMIKLTFVWNVVPWGNGFSHCVN